MSFAVSAQQINGFSALVIEDKLEGIQAIVLPENGAMLHSFIIHHDHGSINTIDNYPDPLTLAQEVSDSFKSCKLSPFACRIPGGRYVYNNDQYEFNNKHYDGSAIHGLLYNKPFNIVEEFCSDNLAGVHLRYIFKKDDAGYPFKYSCDIRYTLLPAGQLQIQTTITNLDSEQIPLADGWHPYFTLGGETDDWMLQLNASAVLEFDEKLIPTGNVIPYDGFLKQKSLKGLSLDNSFILNKNNGKGACILYNPANKISLTFFPDETYPYLQIYTPFDRKSIAIENLSGAPNCFNNGMGLVLLPPGNSKTFTVSYKTNKE